MKKDNLATSTSVQQESSKCELAVSGHEHLHAANCGHKSYVHAGHICYEHDGHFHYMHDGHAHDCPGPKAQPTIVRSSASVSATASKKPATVSRLSDAKAKRAKK